MEDEKRRKRDNSESGGGKDRVKMRKRVGNSRKRAVTEGRGAVSYGGKLRESVGENVMGSSVN